jgi:hypothetical protein
MRNSNALFPFEIWHYKLIEEIGNDVLIDFTDEAREAAYHMTMDRSVRGTRIENRGDPSGSAIQRFIRLNSRPEEPPQ